MKRNRICGTWGCTKPDGHAGLHAVAGADETRNGGRRMRSRIGPSQTLDEVVAATSQPTSPAAESEEVEEVVEEEEVEEVEDVEDVDEVDGAEEIEDVAEDEDANSPSAKPKKKKAAHLHGRSAQAIFVSERLAVHRASGMKPAAERLRVASAEWSEPPSAALAARKDILLSEQQARVLARQAQQRARAAARETARTDRREVERCVAELLREVARKAARESREAEAEAARAARDEKREAVRAAKALARDEASREVAARLQAERGEALQRARDFQVKVEVERWLTGVVKTVAREAAQAANKEAQAAAKAAQVAAKAAQAAAKASRREASPAVRPPHSQRPPKTSDRGPPLPKEPLTSYNHFCVDRYEAIFQALKQQQAATGSTGPAVQGNGGRVGAHIEATRQVGAAWAGLSAEDRAPYDAQARADKQRYNDECMALGLDPNPARTKRGRKPTPANDVHPQSPAEQPLGLLAGKEGQEAAPDVITLVAVALDDEEVEVEEVEEVDDEAMEVMEVEEADEVGEAEAAEGAQEASVKAKRQKVLRCGHCEGCKRECCGTCPNCLDMPRFGGTGKWKQSCVHRVCASPVVQPRCLHLSHAATTTATPPFVRLRLLVTETGDVSASTHAVVQKTSHGVGASIAAVGKPPSKSAAVASKAAAAPRMRKTGAPFVHLSLSVAAGATVGASLHVVAATRATAPAQKKRRERPSPNCDGCQGKHRAHTCGPGGEKTLASLLAAGRSTMHGGRRQLAWECLVDYIVACGGSLKEISTWTCRVLKGRKPGAYSQSAPVFKMTYRSPTGEEFNSRVKVARFLGLSPLSHGQGLLIDSAVRRRTKLKMEAAASGTDDAPRPPQQQQQEEEEEPLGGEEEEVTTWVQCNLCEKWRALSPHHPSTRWLVASPHFSCAQNVADPRHSSCAAPEASFAECGDREAFSLLTRRVQERGGDVEDLLYGWEAVAKQAAPGGSSLSPAGPVDPLELSRDLDAEIDGPALEELREQLRRHMVDAGLMSEDVAMCLLISASQLSLWFSGKLTERLSQAVSRKARSYLAALLSTAGDAAGGEAAVEGRCVYFAPWGECFDSYEAVLVNLGLPEPAENVATAAQPPQVKPQAKRGPGRPPKQPTDPDSRRMEDLRKCLKARGIPRAMVDGWSFRTEFRTEGATAGTNDTYYYSPWGKVCAPRQHSRWRSRWSYPLTPGAPACLVHILCVLLAVRLSPNSSP